MNDPKEQKHEPEAPALVAGKGAFATAASVQSDPSAQVSGGLRGQPGTMEKSQFQSRCVYKLLKSEAIFKILPC